MIREAPDPDKLPFPREVLIGAARQRARGLSWQTIARGTEHSGLQLARLPFDHPEIWEPLYKRAEKLQLQEAEGEGLKALNILLEDKDQIAAEKAARELLVHRRHIAHDRRPRPDRVRALDPRPEPEAKPYPQWLVQEPAPEELRAEIIHLACRRAQGEDLLVTAAEIGRDHQEVARWAFIYPQTWDRCWPTARLETARFYAARALKTLTSLAFGPDRQLAARAARTLLIHRRHMHWHRGHVPEAPGTARGSVRVPGRRDGGLTYPSSVTQAVVAIPGDGSLKVARRSGPARSSGAVRPSASAPSAVKRFLPRARDGP